MQRAAPGSYDADARFHNEPHQFPHPPASSFGSSVTAASPAKRITFYKSGDAQFKGVKMAIHKRSFKCFDALLDDLSQKVPLPFGVRTIMTPRGTHSIKHLEQFEDGGCYLCSDRRYVKPINMEAAGKRPAVWHHHSHPHSTRRKPSRPEEPPSGHHHQHRHPKRIVLVKNNDPTVRRSIILSRRTARSLRVFMEEISELMQCHVKKLYTLEGRKIDSIQSLMQCPSVLVCAGREPFRPFIMESLKKLSDEKLPGMGTRSHSSICSEGHESKKNVNFGLETKKSIIHPRSDSSNRSTRFSLSSEKSYQNGLCMTPGQSGCVSTCPYVKEAIVNDDIEKRVLVNKDGSLSVEMKVRFRLFNDETLQWSTEIKKSSSKVNDSGSVKDAEYLQAKSRYLDPESVSASETDEGFATKLHQGHLEETLRQNCCNHCQEYDIWKNPMHKGQEACKSPSSSGSSHKVVRKKSSVDSTRTISRSSGEYMEHVVEKASCFQQTLEEGDTRMEYCAIRRCCSRSEVSSAGIMSKSKKSYEEDCESHVKNKFTHTDITDPEISPTPLCEFIKVTEERPISAVSNSSKVLESLKEDQDDDYDDLPPSVSRASNWSQSDHLESDDRPKCVHCCGHQTPQSYLSPRPPSKESSSAVHSLKLKKYKATFASPVEPDGMSTISPVSKVSHPCHSGAITPNSAASGPQHEFNVEARSRSSRHSHASCKSRSLANTPGSNALDNDAVNRSLSATSGVSKRSAISGVCSCCGERKRLTENPEVNEPEKADSTLSKSNKSAASISNAQENCEPVNNTLEGEATGERSETALSKNSNASSTSKISKKSNCSAHEMCPLGKLLKSEPNEATVEERTKSAMSAESDCVISERAPTPNLVLTEMDNTEEKSQERAISPMSAHSNLSVASKTSHKSHSEKSKLSRSCSPNYIAKVPSNLFQSQGDKSETAATQDNLCEQDTDFPQDVRSASAMSNKSNHCSEHASHTSEKTERSVKSCCELQDEGTLKPSSPNVQRELETEFITEERLCSPLSSCSKTSFKSNVSSKHSHKSESKERVPSAMSVRTNASKGSCRSRKSNHNIPETTVTSVPNDATPDECATPKKSKRASSSMSQTSEKSNACSERSIKSGGKENVKDTTQNALFVTSPSPRRKRSPSPRSTHGTEIKKTDSRAPSGMSATSDVSSKSRRSCNCQSSSSGKLRETKPEMVNENAKDEYEDSLSVKSKLSAKSQIINDIKSSGNQFDEPLSPTSTTSVSLGLGEEHKGDDFDGRSISGVSATTEDGGQQLESMNGVDPEERPKTEASVNSGKSKKSRHKNCKTPVQAFSPVSAESVMSAEQKKSESGNQLIENNIRVPSTLSLSSSRSKSPSRVSQASAKNIAKKEKVCEAVNNTDCAEMTEASLRGSGKTTPASDCLNSSKASEHSVKTKNGQSTRESDNKSKCSSHCLEINNDGGTVKSLKTSASDKRSVKNDASRPNSAVMSDISQKSISLPQEIANKKTASVKLPDSSSESVLSRALSAADLLREIVGNARPVSRGSKGLKADSSKNVEKVENKSQKSSRSQHKKVSISLGSDNKELMPSCLPNASPTEVVNDWLRNIPIDGYVYEMDIDVAEDVTQDVEMSQDVTQDASQRDKSEAPTSIIEVEETHEDQVEENPIQQETNDICVETQVCDERAQVETHEMEPNPEALTKQDSLQKQCHSSVQVMKVLLGPKLDRSSSLPEVSPVYGRKLSQSAQGFLDCLANLRLIDSDSKNEKHHKYNEVMTILQSLWLQKPFEDEQKKQNIKDHQSAEDEFNPRSSSGVDVSSGSSSSVKGSMKGVVEKIETAQSTIPPIAEREVSLQDKDEEDEVKSASPECECLDPCKVHSDPITPDIAERVQGSQVNTQLDDDQENGVLQDDIESSENKNESDETPQTTSYKSSGNESSTVKSPENTSSGTPPSVQRAPLTKRVSQDPDPVWVLSLLKKLEKQFMLHYADAMAEFKVRWDLDDNEMLNTMISELKEEVHKRIQSSINRELQKIQSRAGRGPRPPGNALSRDSTVQTEQRRKRLRVMRNKSILSRSDEIYTTSGTENSDQRSDDEYCPCDACIRKKMESRAAQRAQALSSAPVMIEFDLRKILQMKKEPVKPPESKPEEQSTTSVMCQGEKDENNLEVVHEEVEEVNDDTQGQDVETADRDEADGGVNAVDEGENSDDIKDVSKDSDSEKRDLNEEETNNGDVEGVEDGEEKEEEMLVNGKEEEVESVEEETEKEASAEDNVEEKDSAKEDEANTENSDTAVEVEKGDEMTEVGEGGSGDKEAQTETGEESTEDQSAEDGDESQSNKDGTPETTEGENPDEPPIEESTSEKSADGNQDGSADEDRTSDTEQPEDQPEENGKSPEVEMEVEENETEGCSPVEEHDKSDEAVDDDSESTLAKQVTRTSVESQPGSMENCTNQTTQAKLKGLQSFMESVESQGESVVVITKQPPYKEPRGPGNQKNMCNGLTEWQVSPKISNRANKQKNQKNGQ